MKERKRILKHKGLHKSSKRFNLTLTTENLATHKHENT